MAEHKRLIRRWLLRDSYDRWLRESLGEEVERRFAPGQPIAELIEPAEAARLVAEHRSPGAPTTRTSSLLPARAVGVAPRLHRGARARGRVKRVLFVHSRKASFVAIDRGFLAERFEIDDLYQPGRVPNPLKVVRGVLRADLVFGWFASWHTFLPIGLAGSCASPRC